MKKIWTGIIAVALIMAGTIGLFIKINWIPGKYAVKESDFSRYEPYILVKKFITREPAGYKPEMMMVIFCRRNTSISI